MEKMITNFMEESKKVFEKSKNDNKEREYSMELMPGVSSIHFSIAKEGKMTIEDDDAFVKSDRLVFCIYHEVNGESDVLPEYIHFLDEVIHIEETLQEQKEYLETVFKNPKVLS